MERRIEHIFGNALPVSFKESRPFPGAGQALAERQQMNVLKSGLSSLLEVQVGQQKIHHHAGRTPGGIAMPLQHIAQRHHIFGGFERVIIVGIFPQMNSAGPKLLVPFAVAHTHAPPIIALQENQRTAEPEVATWGFAPHALSLSTNLGIRVRTDSPANYRRIQIMGVRSTMPGRLHFRASAQ